MPYNVPRRKSRSYKKNAFDNNLLKLVSSILVLIIGITLAGLLALKLYLISLPPIKNLNSLKPNIVTTFCASDGEVIKTFESKENPARYKSQITLAKRRVQAFEIANYFIIKQIEGK